MTANPFLSIWTQPRATVSTQPSTARPLPVLALTMLVGVGQTLQICLLGDLRLRPLSAVIATVLLVGPLAGLVWFWFVSKLVYWLGRMFGGTATPAKIRLALAWASVPTVAALLLWIPRLLLFGTALLQNDLLAYHRSPLSLVFGLLDAALAVWSFVLFCHTLSEAQGYESAWVGFGNAVIAGAFSLPSLVVLYMVVGGILSR